MKLSALRGPELQTSAQGETERGAPQRPGKLPLQVGGPVASGLFEVFPPGAEI